MSELTNALDLEAIRESMAVVDKWIDSKPDLDLEVLSKVLAANVHAHVLMREVERIRRQVDCHQADLAEVEQTLGRALGYPVAGPEIGGNGTAIMTGEHTPASLAAEAAKEIERLRIQRDVHRQRIAVLEAAVLGLAFTNSAMDGQGPCWCKFPDGDYRPHFHSALCIQARTALKGESNQ